MADLQPAQAGPDLLFPQREKDEKPKDDAVVDGLWACAVMPQPGPEPTEDLVDPEG